MHPKLRTSNNHGGDATSSYSISYGKDSRTYGLEEIEGQVITIIDSLKAGNVDSLTSKINDIFKGQESKIEKIKDKIKFPIFKKKTG